MRNVTNDKIRRAILLGTFDEHSHSSRAMFDTLLMQRLRFVPNTENRGWGSGVRTFCCVSLSSSSALSS